MPGGGGGVAPQGVPLSRSSTLKSHSCPTPVDGRAGQGADIRAGFRHMPVAGSRQFAEQRSCVLEIGGIEALGEPAVHGCEQPARFWPPALLAPQPGETRRGAQFVGPCLLTPRDAQRLFESALALLEPVET